jgi:penicillin-binding protein 2A
MKTKTLLKKLVIAIFIVVALFMITPLTIYVIVTHNTELDLNKFGKFRADTVILDSNGRPIEHLSSCVRYTEYDAISPYILNAFIALEDKRFLSHKGVDYIRVFGASLNNVKARSLVEGASTITQQLVKNTLLSSEKTVYRKLNEIKLAKLLEEKFSKSEILTMYLNVIYFGDGIFGITRACEVFFGKSPSNVSLQEASMLAGIVKNPSKYSPLSNLKLANERKNLTLKLMRGQNLISKAEYSASTSNLVVEANTKYSEYNRGYIKAALSEASQLLNMSERDILSSGYIISSYHDQNLQKYIEDSMKNLAFDVQNAQKSVLICDNRSASAIAYHSTSENRIFEFRRSPASIIKPILVYAPSIELGLISPDSLVLDEPTSFGNYQPKNYASKYLGYTNVRDALKNSSNIVAVKLLDNIGIERAKSLAQNMGLKFKSDNGLALALGGMTQGATIPEICESYMTLANGGEYSALSFIKSIKNRDGKLVYSRSTTKTRVLSEGSAYLTTDMLRDVAKTGTARKLATLKIDIASKTGTAGDSNGNSDAWSMTYTPNVTMCVWYGSRGSNLPKLSSSVTGGTYPTLLAKHIYSRLSTTDKFSRPESVVDIEFDTMASFIEGKPLLASSYTPNEYRKTGLFLSDYAPSLTSTYFDNAPPLNFKSLTSSNTVELSFEGDPQFVYKLFCRKSSSDICLTEFTGSNYYTFTDTINENSILSYYIDTYDASGVYICSSEFLNIIVRLSGIW